MKMLMISYVKAEEVRAALKAAAEVIEGVDDNPDLDCANHLRLLEAWLTGAMRPKGAPIRIPIGPREVAKKEPHKEQQTRRSRVMR